MKPISVFFLCFLLISCSEDSKSTNTVPESKSKYDVLKDSVPPKIEEDIYEHRVEIQRDTIRARSAGVIDWIRPNRKISKGQTLFSYDNYKAFNELQTKKINFKAQMAGLIDASTGDLNYVKSKWKKFFNSLRTDTLLPKFPKIEYREEGIYYGNESVTKQYNEVATLEREMKSNFVTAKDDYARIQWKVKKGSNVKKGQIIAVCTPHDSLLVSLE